MIKLVATDIDGTLWTRDATGEGHVVHPTTAEAAEELRRRGIDLLVVTGRRRRSALLALTEIFGPPGQRDVRIPAGLLDGAYGCDLDSGERWHHGVIDADAALAVLAVLTEHGLSPAVYLEDAGGWSRRSDGADVVVTPATSTHPAHLAVLQPVVEVPDLTDVCATGDVVGFGIAGGDPAHLAAVAEEIEAGGLAHATATRDLAYGGATLIVRPHGTSKWAAIEAWCAHTGVDPASEVLAIGDGENDLDMLTNAPVGIAPADASPLALEAATHVVRPTADGGWADLLDYV